MTWPRWRCGVLEAVEQYARTGNRGTFIDLMWWYGREAQRHLNNGWAVPRVRVA